MKEYAYTVLLKDDPGIIAEYKKQHAAVWPEVVASFKELGVLRIRIWLLGCRLFMLLETKDNFDPAVAWPAHRAKGGRIIEWENWMDTFQDRKACPTGWVELKKVCDI
jgi:L-rhamnose mutarotase